MNISLPEKLKFFVDGQVAGRYRTSSEYVRELIRREQTGRSFATSCWKAPLLRPLAPPTNAWFEDLRQHAVKHAKK